MSGTSSLTDTTMQAQELAGIALADRCAYVGDRLFHGGKSS